MKKLSIIIALAAVYLTAPPISHAQIQWPAITHENRPWGRWWWQGSAVTKPDLAWTMEQYKAAGLGGMEITPVYGVKGTEKQFIPFLSPRWMDMLKYTVQQGKRLDMGIDMANATGWPFGGPWVDYADATKELFWKSYNVKEGDVLNETVTFVQAPYLTQAGTRVKINEIKQPFVANNNLQQLGIEQIRYPVALPLSVLMAYNQSGSAINLTSKVGADGRLDWKAPAGDWKLYAVFTGSHGKMVERAAPGGEGYVIDHFSKRAINNYLKNFDKPFDPKNGKLIRAFFNDSYEVDDANGEANFTPALFEEFKTRRGYDLRNHLPGLLTADGKEADKRILYDYRLTISELLLDNFTKPWQEWARSKGSVIRNQAHGSPANILDLYAASDIPETEGNDVMSFKFATSAAHVSGKRLASTESGTWMNEHFMTKLSDVKESVDRCFVGGVNHVFYHGVNYSPKNVSWPGWLFYAAVNFTPADPFWRDFGTLNNYFARCQSFLQQGKPDNDVLLYTPIADSFSDYGGSLLKHYHNMDQFKAHGFEKSAREMLAKGYTFDFISDRQLMDVKQNSNNLLTGGGNYKTLIIPDCSLIPLSTLQRIVELATNGAQIIVLKNLPNDVAGLYTAETKAKFDALIRKFNFADLSSGVKKAVIGKGSVLIGDDLQKLLNTTAVKRETMTDAGLQFSRRSNENGKTYFIVNQTRKAVNQNIQLNTNAVSATIFNPMTERYGLATTAKQLNNTLMYIQLQPGESCIVQTFNTVKKGQQYANYEPAGNATKVSGTWNLKFEHGGPELPPSVQLGKLKAWTDLEGESYQSFSGVGSYSITFPMPKEEADMWQLNLEKAFGSVEVYLNDTKIATLLGPQYTVNIPAGKFKQSNKLEFKVVNSMANRIKDMEKKNIPYKIFYNVNFQPRDQANRGADRLFTALNMPVQPSGMVGNVTVAPLRLMK
ncbi:glycosyl hydrolase [Mucilaginibacter aquatilis]|uniref:Glycoside hydrolase family 2 protein n=1 Tax=Mucilaginibacter aquatilis TaxID=1517760 RepID=A0A6I4IAQ2_9SPHI|nr:glycosyl hydrolase [Mucilaginibacter aquatilis]MVN90596.1 glycoside hydrolase family 2 protein [Mucilaginibacter aquatilis]